MERNKNMFWTMYKREMMVASRNLKMPVSIITNNIILGFVAGFSYYIEFQSRGNLGRTVNGKAILNIFSLLTIIEFGVVVISMIMLTIPCVLKERRNHTFDVLLTAGISPLQFLLAKLLSRVTVVMTVVISACPVMGIVYYVGGIDFRDMLIFLGILLITAFFMGSIGLFCSSYCKRTMTATVSAYGVGFLIIFGTLLVIGAIFLMQGAKYGIDLSDRKSIVPIGRVTILLLVNPLYNILKTLNYHFGTMEDIFRSISPKDHIQLINSNWVLYSCILQIILSDIIMCFSARRIRGKK